MFMHWTQWMESVLIRPQGISLNMHAHAILSKIFSIMKSRSPGTRFVFIHWLSIKTIRKRKNIGTITLKIEIQCSPLISNSRGPTKFILIMRCSNYEFVLNINWIYNELSRNHNQLSELTGFLN